MRRSKDYSQYLTERGRLVILQVLAAEFNGHLREELIQRALDAKFLERSLDWLRTQLHALAEIGAIKIIDDDGSLIASITRTGRDHVDRRTPLGGVAWPED